MIFADVTKVRVAAGSTRFCHVPEPDTGSSCSFYRKQQDQHDGHPESRQRLAQRRKSIHQKVERAVAEVRRGNPQHDTHYHRACKRHAGQLQRIRHALQHQAERILIILIRGAKIAPQQISYVDEELLIKRLVQPQSFPESSFGLLARLRRQHQGNRVARHIYQAENNQRQDQKHGNDLHDPFQQISTHGKISFYSERRRTGIADAPPFAGCVADAAISA